MYFLKIIKLNFELKFWEKKPIGVCSDKKTACRYVNESYCLKYGEKYVCRCHNGYYGADCEESKEFNI